MNPNIPKDLIAVKDGEHVMGYYALFTVPEREVNVSRLGAAWAAEALPMNLVPTDRKEVDVFKRACRSVETRRTTGSDRVLEIKVDQVSEDRETCVYQITRMVRNKKQQVIEHPKAMRVRFIKGELRMRETAGTYWYEEREEEYLEPINDLEFEPLTSNTAGLNELEESIRDHYLNNGATVTASKIRTAIRGLMNHIGGIGVRKKGGGVYFVPKDGRDELESLIRVLHRTYGNDAEAHLIPCASEKYQQEMVQRHFESNVSQEIDETMARVADKLLANRNIRHDALANMFARRKELGSLRTRYSAMVGEDMATIDEKLSLLDQQLGKLMEKVGEKRKRTRKR